VIHRSTIKARELLKDLPYVEIIDEQLGYIGDDFELFVSKWDDRLDNRNKILIKSYLNKILTDNDPKKYDELVERISKIKERLRSYHDLHYHNMVYDIKKDKIVLFDLQENKN
jgi:hypothetical protein